MPDFTELVDLASERVGGAAIAANDDFFAPRENLVKAARPIWREGEYTDRGKWMDGWETRRRREPGHDWCVVRLGLAGRIAGVVVDTAFFVGNHPESCSLDGAAIDAGADGELRAEAVSWSEILPRTPLHGDAENRLPVLHAGRVTHVRLNIFPDGGVARLRVYGLVLPDWDRLAPPSADIDLAAIDHGGRVVAASDMFFGSRHNLILPGPSRGMSDGWETRRRRGPGNDWAIVRLGAPGRIRGVDVDTTHFKGNAPGSCSIETTVVSEEDDPTGPEWRWRVLLPETRLEPHKLHRFERELAEPAEATHARLNIFPDGGVSRLHLFGRRSTA